MAWLFILSALKEVSHRNRLPVQNRSWILLAFNLFTDAQWLMEIAKLHTITQSQAITYRVTPLHTLTLAHLSHSSRLVQSTVRSFFAYSKCICLQALLLSPSQDVSFSLLQYFFFSFFSFSSPFLLLLFVLHLSRYCCSQLALPVESSAMRSW